MKTLLIALMCIAALAADPKIAGGPYVVNVTSKTATIAWLVSDNDVTVQSPAGAASIQSPAFHVEKNHAHRPDRQHPLRIRDPRRHRCSASKQRRRGRHRSPSWLSGDNRTRPAIHQRVIDGIVAHGIPDFILQSGDLVADGDDNSLWATFFSIEKNLLRQTAIFLPSATPEHNSRNFYDIFQRDKGYYSFDWGNAHFAVINSDIANVSKIESVRAAFWEEQTHWLEEDLKAHQGADYRFVACHHPPFTAVASRQGDNPHITALTPMLEKYNVTAGFFGHDHNYQHYLKNGIHYIVSGGGGAPLYDVDKPPVGITQKVASIENFVSVSVDGKTAHVQASRSTAKCSTISHPAVRSGVSPAEKIAPLLSA